MKWNKYLLVTTALLANAVVTPMTMVAETIASTTTSEVVDKVEKTQEEDSKNRSVSESQEEIQEKSVKSSLEEETEQPKAEVPSTPEETRTVESEEKTPEECQESEEVKEETDSTPKEEEKVNVNDVDTNTLNLVNGSFEDRRVTYGSPTHRNWFYYEGVNLSELGWKGLNTNEAMLCLGQYIQAPEGSQWLEVPNKADSAVYQDIQTTPGTKIGWSLYQRGFNGVGYMAVEMGAPDGSLTIQEEMKTDDAGGSGGWTKHSGVYTVPEGQTTTRFQIRSLQIGPSSFVDGVKLSDETMVNTIKYVDEEGQVVKTEEISGVEFEPYDYTEKVETVDIPGYVVNQEKIPENIKGEFTAENQEIIVPCRTKSTITVKYIYDNGQEQKELQPSKTIDGLLGDNYDVSTSDYKLKIPKYFLDEDRLPENATGKFTKEPTEVVYYYKAMPTSIVNGGFEDPVISDPTYSSYAGVYYQKYSKIPGWKTNGTRIELQKAREGVTVPAIEGNQWGELNCDNASTLYQDIDTTPGETLYWEVYHKGTVGTDTAAVEIGAPNGQLVEQQQMTTEKNTWKKYSGFYTVPEGQTETRFQLKSISPTTENGNLVDNVIFTNVKSTITVNFVDKTGNPIKEPQIVTGYKGQLYDLTDVMETPIPDYKLDESKLPEGIKGTFTDEDKELTLVYKQEGTVNVKYIFEGNDQEIAPSQTLIGERGETYDVSTEQYKLDLTSEGYHLDEERLPENATGTFAKEPTEVVYYYKAVSTSLINGGFERPVIDNPTLTNGHHVQYYPNGQVPGWTGQNGRIQLQTDSTVIPAIEGNQWVEINTSGVGIYQDVETTPGDKLYWEFYHRGALATSSAAVDIGASDGNLVEQMQITTGTDSWTKYSGFYIVPEGQTKTRFQLRNINGYAGNVFDAVVFTNEKAIVTIKYVNERGEEIKASEEKHGWEGERYDYTKEITDTVIPGYAIDAEKMPSNIKGAFTREDQVITVHYKTVNVNIPSQDVDNTKPEETSLFGIAYMPKQFQTGKTVLNDAGAQSVPVNKTDRFDVGVRDLRNKENQWTLSAQLVWNEGKELPGSFIKTTNSTGAVMKNINNGTDSFNPDTDLTEGNDGVQGGTNVEITKVPTPIMTANMGKYNAVYNYNLGDVSLEIPDAGMVEPGSYSGNVIWSLENVLGNETTPPVEKQYSFKVNEYLSPQLFNSYEEAEEARHNYVMDNFKRGSREPTSMVTNSEHGNLDIPEEYLKYKYRVVFYVSAILPPGAPNPEVVSDKKFVTYQQAENYLEECIQRTNIIYVPSLGAYTEVSSVKESSVTNIQGEDISGPIE